MNASDFRKLIESAGGTILGTEKVNTNNAWGFGGWFGLRTSAQVGDKLYFFDKGRASTRHAGTFSLERVWVDAPRSGSAFCPKFFSRLFVQGIRSYEEFRQEAP